MHTALTLGAVRLHVFRVVPGREGEPRRLSQALARVEPRFIACEVDPAHALALQQTLAGARHEAPFLPRLLAEEIARRHDGEATDPFVGAARYAREEGVSVLPILPSAPRPGFLARRRLRKLVTSVPTGDDEAVTLANVEDALRANGTIGAERAAADAAAARRLAGLVLDDGLPRVAAVLTAVRASHVVEGVRARAPPSPREGEAPRETARQEVQRDAYPAYR